MSGQAKVKTVWALWGLTTLLTACLACTARLVVFRARIYYERLDLREIPLLTEFTIAWGVVILWILVILMAVVVAYMITRKGPETGQLWVIIQAVLFLGIAVLMLLALASSFEIIRIQMTPSGR